MKSIVILISGRGSNMESLLNGVADGTLPVRVAAVISNRPDAKGLEALRRRTWKPAWSITRASIRVRRSMRR
jgi:folate-dependent phosphoribosylglycinamide formyltransferase PurN